MVITVLEARVDKAKWENLKEAYRTGASMKPGQMVESFLVQNRNDPDTWQGISVWKSKEALEEYRASVATPGGVLIFKSVGAEPVLTIYDVEATLE